MKSQALISNSHQAQSYQLKTERLGPLPIINHYLKKLQIEKLLEEFVPTLDARVQLPYKEALGVLLRSILVEREPIYRQQETVSHFAPSAFGLKGSLIHKMGDDRIGRALDRLFQSDRGSLLTKIVLTTIKRYDVNMDELHNDSTTVRLTGQYTQAKGRYVRGKRAPWVTRGHSKDHRPDLKQLLFILTNSADGGIPVQFRCEDGCCSDSRTHQETWEALRQIAGKIDFLYVADSKLCSGENMKYISRQGGRFVTVIPRNRNEDALFRKWVQTNQPQWEEVWNRENPRRKDGPRDIWKVFRYEIPSLEGWPVIWVHSSLLASHQQHSRQQRLSRAIEELTALNKRLSGPRPRQKSKDELQKKIESTVNRFNVGKYFDLKILHIQRHRYKQERRGRPSKNMCYKRISQKRFQIQWQIIQETIDYDANSDGMYSLLTNDRKLSNAEVLKAHKRQPIIENRFKQVKNVYEIAPVFLKNEGRIEALFFLFYLALLVESIIERQLRRNMKKNDLEHIPLYPEERKCHRPTTDQVFRLFSLIERHHLLVDGDNVGIFNPQLTSLQEQILCLLDVPKSVYFSDPQ